MRNEIDMSPLLVSLLERSPEQTKQIFGPILSASQNLRITTISIIWNCLSSVVLKCSRRKG